MKNKYNYLAKLASLTSEIDRAGMHKMASKLDKILKQTIASDDEEEWLDDEDQTAHMVNQMQSAMYDNEEDIFNKQRSVADAINNVFDEELHWKTDVDDKLYTSSGPFNLFVEIQSEYRGPSKFLVTIENRETDGSKTWTIDADKEQWKVREDADRLAREMGQFIAQ